jgi:hypothetical protein
VRCLLLKYVAAAAAATAVSSLEPFVFRLLVVQLVYLPICINAYRNCLGMVEADLCRKKEKSVTQQFARSGHFIHTQTRDSTHDKTILFSFFWSV